MKLVNLFFLKGMNGMFFYCLDYIGDQEVVILLRKGSNFQFPTKNKNYTFVEVSNFLELARFIFTKKYDLLYCPTPHPIPFAVNQYITIHDFYPFLGVKGLIKYILLLIGVVTSKAKIILINNTLENKRPIKFILTKKIFAPNKIAQENKLLVEEKIDFQIGLIGTDSTKKNYDKLFSAFPTEILRHCAIYGNVNSYSNQIIDQYGADGLTHVKVDECSLDEFINRCQGIVSVANGEGFGRPLAKSILRGKPLFLIEDPIFREFFDGSANFFNSIQTLSDEISPLIKSQSINTAKINAEQFLKKADEINMKFTFAQKEIFDI